MANRTQWAFGLVLAGLTVGAASLGIGMLSQDAGASMTNMVSTAGALGQLPEHGEAPQVNPVTGEPVRADHPLGMFRTATMFADTFRASHIIRGHVVDCEWPSANTLLTIRPFEYLKGDPLPDQLITVQTLNNADLRFTVGEETMVSVILRDDGAIGLAHGITSMTTGARGWNVQASVNLINDLLAINSEFEDEVSAAYAQAPADANFRVPTYVREAWTGAFVRAFEATDSWAAYQAGMELTQNPTFQNEQLAEGHLATIARALRASKPATYDRGYGYILLARHAAPLISIEEAISHIREERADVILDHIAVYLATCFPDTEVVPALAAIYGKPTRTFGANGFKDDERANAILVAGQFGSRKALPTLLPLLGYETTARPQRELLKTMAALSHESNYLPLVSYLNGGVATTPFEHVSERSLGERPRFQYDTLNSVYLHKLTFLAIAMIDSPESNELIDLAFEKSRVPELKHFLRPLREVNKGWRHYVNMMAGESDVSLQQLHDRYVELGVMLPIGHTEE
jgi:hypothetical protein